MPFPPHPESHSNPATANAAITSRLRRARPFRFAAVTTMTASPSRGNNASRGEPKPACGWTFAANVDGPGPLVLTASDKPIAPWVMDGGVNVQVVPKGNPVQLKLTV